MGLTQRVTAGSAAALSGPLPGGGPALTTPTNGLTMPGVLGGAPSTRSVGRFAQCGAGGKSIYTWKGGCKRWLTSEQ